MQNEPITKSRAKKASRGFQWACEVIWAILAFTEEPKSNDVFQGIGANKEVQKSINVIMDFDGNNSHDFGIQKDKKMKENLCPNEFATIWSSTYQALTRNKEYE